jgi:hypothetical protein
VNILDENVLKNQRQILQSWRISIRQIGYDVGRKGMKDDEIIPFLHSLRRPTFFTRDLGFYDHSLCHTQYCLVCMAVGKYEAATFVRRLLRHPEFNTQAKRMGAVIRVSRAGLRVWRLHAEQETALSWGKG